MANKCENLDDTETFLGKNNLSKFSKDIILLTYCCVAVSLKFGSFFSSHSCVVMFIVSQSCAQEPRLGPPAQGLFKQAAVGMSAGMVLSSAGVGLASKLAVCLSRIYPPLPPSLPIHLSVSLGGEILEVLPPRSVTQLGCLSSARIVNILLLGLYSVTRQENC